jgi:polysaccharide biosynthesis transport protein
MESEGQNLQNILEITKRRKWSIVIPAVSLFVAIAGIALVIPPKYRSISTILIEEQEIPRDYVTSTVTGFAEQRLYSINQRIMSTPKLLEIINKFNLYADIKATKTTEEIITRMRKDIKFQTISADVIDPRTGRPTPATIAFSLSYLGENPALVQKVANVLASLYLEENLKVREQQTQGTSQFMEEETNIVKSRLEAVDAKIAAFKRQNLNSLPELAQLNYQELDRIDRDTDQLNAQLRSLKEREAYLQAQLATIPTDSASQDKTRLNELRVQLGNLRSRVSEEYPDVKKVKLEIAALEKRMRISGQDGLGSKPDNSAYITMASQLASTQNEIESVKRQISSMEKKRVGTSRRIQAAPRVEEGYKALLTERSNLQAKNDELSKKYMESKVSHALEKEQKGERFTIIDAARLPEKPVSPNIPAILLIALVFGLGAGVGTAALREFFDRSVRTSDDLARATGYPVLAAIPEIVTMKEIMRRRNLRKMLLAGTTAGIVGGLLVFHFLFMDINVFWARLLRRLMI